MGTPRVLAARDVISARRAVSWVLIVPVLFLAGCGGSPPPLDGHIARTSLTTFLDSWKAGKTLESLREGPLEIIAGDHRWKSGMRLLSYQVLEPSRSDGSNLHATVQLELEDAEGNTVREEVTYIVGTRPEITIFAEE